jgi:hypothetical protein
MEPVVNRLVKKYRACLEYERVNFHDPAGPWHKLIGPLASPEFALVDSSKKVLYRWFGATDIEQFEEVLAPICNKTGG